jgi:hypothetical protein
VFQCILSRLRGLGTTRQKSLLLERDICVSRYSLPAGAENSTVHHGNTWRDRCAMRRRFFRNRDGECRLVDFLENVGAITPQ